MQPTVRVVIPCFNYGRFVRAAAESALALEDCTAEVVIVDDGSTDQTTAAECDRCRSLGTGRPGPGGVEVIHQENRGLPGARNAGARGAATDYLVFLDADDWLLPGFVRVLHASIAEEAACAGAEGRADDVSHAYGFQQMAELADTVWRCPDWDPVLEMVTNIHPPTALVRRDRFEAAGGYNEDMRGGYEDWDFWLKFVERGWRGVRSPEVVYVWRRHSNDTMIHEAVRRHDELFSRILDHHAPLYAARSREVIAMSNAMLRRFDVNWLDENLDAIPLEGLRRYVRELEELRETLSRQRDSARADAKHQRERADAAAGQLESHAAVRAAAKIKNSLRKLGPLGRPLLWMIDRGKRMA